MDDINGFKLMIVESFIPVLRAVLSSQELRQDLTYDVHGRSALDFSGGGSDVKNFNLLALV